MPRRKASDDGMPTEKPAGFTDEQWYLGKSLGNVSLACRLLEVASGEDTPKDESETVALIEAANTLERKAFGKWRRLQDSIGTKIADARSEYQASRLRVNHLSGLLDDPAILTKHRADHGEPGGSITGGQPVSGTSAPPIAQNAAHQVETKDGPGAVVNPNPIRSTANPTPEPKPGAQSNGNVTTTRPAGTTSPVQTGTR